MKAFARPNHYSLNWPTWAIKALTKTITRYVAALRGPTHTPPGCACSPKAPPSKLLVSQAAFLLGKPAEKLDEDEKKIVQHYAKLQIK